MLGIRWTIGDVSTHGFEALPLSLWGAWRIFGTAEYVVLVNTVSVHHARQLVGRVPAGARWRRADAQVPRWLQASASRIEPYA